MLDRLTTVGGIEGSSPAVWGRILTCHSTGMHRDAQEVSYEWSVEVAKQ